MNARAMLKPMTGGLLLAVLAAAVSADEIEDGRRIYQQGILPSGQPLTGVRFDRVTVTGAQAACITCHRRSGMGSVEGDTQVPPVTGRFLFSGRDGKALAVMDRRSGRSMNQRHAPYDEATLARAIREGLDVEGRRMDVVMPHFALSDADTGALIAYLRQLSAGWSPGVTDHTIRFATVVTPGVEPARRDALLATLRAAFAQKNGSTITARAGGRRHMVSAAEMVLGTERNWLLDVWELHGDPATWRAQLEEYYRREPVFALVSGTSNTTWEPVHGFCEDQHIPCWFPSVALPVTAPADYALYYSRGVELEAEVLGRTLAGEKKPPRRVIQVRREDEAGKAAAQSFLRAAGQFSTEERVITDAPDAFANALAQVRDGDAVVFWLRPADLERLGTIEPPAGARFYFSGELAGASLTSIPERWRPRARVVYPYELPQQREANMEYFRAWLAIRKLPMVDEALQGEAYFATEYLASTLAEMLDNLDRDYLLERATDMLGRTEGARAEDQTRVVLVRGPTTNRPRGGTTLYPRLNLGPGQRFASKGAWIVGFDTDAGRLKPESAWITP